MYISIFKRMPAFKDNFSKQSDIYVKYRPHYPAGLYSYLSSLSQEHQLAWDCGTGNGQAAIGLAEFYKTVIATDPSEQQIKNALPNARVEYRVEKAENTSLESRSIDLVTIANALHWFDFEVFYAEVKRVLKPNGLIAAWAYTIPSVSPEVDRLLRHYHDHILGDYWLPENRLVEKEYKTIPFPFQEVLSPGFFSERMMTLEDLTGYLNTWSATQRFINEHKFNPAEQLRKELISVWGEKGSEKKLTWKLTLKVGKI